MKNEWNHGKVLETISDRSYAVLVEETGNIIRRNRVDLKAIPDHNLQQPNIRNNTVDINPSVTHENEQLTEQSSVEPKMSEMNQAEVSTTEESNNKVRRSNRNRKLPMKYKDFQMN